MRRNRRRAKSWLMGQFDCPVVSLSTQTRPISKTQQKQRYNDRRGVVVIVVLIVLYATNLLPGV